MLLDPIVGNNSSWKVIMEDASASASQSEPGDLRCTEFFGKNKLGRHAL
jgi:hypothetical protein